MSLIDMLQLLVSNALLYAAPLILTAIGGTFSERSGVVNIGLEGIMVIGAFSGALANFFLAPQFGSWSPWISLIIAGLFGLIYSALHAVATIHLRADHTISGTVLNLAAPALTVFLCRALTGSAQTGPLAVPFINRTLTFLSKIPLIGPILFVNTPPVAWFSFFLALIAWLVLFKTRFGLRLRSVGESPLTAESLGINVYAMKYAGVLISGFLGGIGGAIQSQAIANEFAVTTISGQGYMALAAMIFGHWHPIGATLSAVFFGLAQALGYASNYIPGLSGIPDLWLQILPYLITLVTVVFFIGKSVGPKANGVTYVKSK
ncbi:MULTISPECIES: ABC transporter permease [Aerococcus]|uniref:ABC transporter permease n=1 Tax=Aerococcus TaxID=1375 RepID=UPI0018A7A6EA|nr:MULTISPECIES: ABC transporter permease [Aerococcus]MCY3035937.1 ABC transporter permease [Aerococcus sp. Group 2]MCY3039033.1 ABC transporter permease [Aerococcus sp. Group 2]MCY3040605.1 ABC transporter permease [Aerococcus sp. Group 2]MCY3042601.1 ABC transporter permease [Aerococcus sp. Group 2]MDK6520049.1 ABC transporter permease [Aerococcus urinae]